LAAANVRIKDLETESENWQKAHDDAWQALTEREKTLSEYEGSQNYRNSRTNQLKEKISDFQQKIYNLMNLLESVEKEFFNKIGKLPSAVMNIDWRKEYDPKRFVSKIDVNNTNKNENDNSLNNMSNIKPSYVSKIKRKNSKENVTNNQSNNQSNNNSKKRPDSSKQANGNDRFSGFNLPDVDEDAVDDNNNNNNNNNNNIINSYTIDQNKPIQTNTKHNSKISKVLDL